MRRPLFFLVFMLASTPVLAERLSVSLVHLIAFPEKFIDKKVHVYGYYNGGESRLYLTKNHAEGHDFMSSIEVADFSEMGEMRDACDANLVYVWGVFKFDTSGQLLTLTDIDKIIKSDGSQCWDG